MKKTICLLLTAAWLCLLVGMSGVALADERTISVTEWKCTHCSKHFFTFTPDSLDGQSNLQHKNPQYQQANWLYLKNRNHIIKCPKAADGAHFFTKIREQMTSGSAIGAKIDTYIILKNSSTIKTKINKIQCIGCKKEAFAFYGDDMDVADYLTVKEPAHVYMLHNKTKVSACNKVVLGNGKKLSPHIFAVRSTTSMSSANIAANITHFMYSD